MDLDVYQYKMIVESSPNMLWRAGTDGLCNYFNRTWLEFTGRAMAQEMGNGWAEGVHSEDLDYCLKIYLEAFTKREAFEMVYRLMRHDGEYRWINDNGVPFYDEEGEFQGYIGSCIDITEQVRGEAWRYMAQKDGLTGINSRQYFEQIAREEFGKSLRYRKKLCVIMIDIDNFKFFNDHFGHQFGDKVIVTFANILKDNIRNFDILGRYGGDEFIIMLPDTSIEEAQKLIKRIHDKFKHPFQLNEDSSINLSFSEGFGLLEENDTFESLVAKADNEMYNKKNKYKQLFKKDIRSDPREKDDYLNCF